MLRTPVRRVTDAQMAQAGASTQEFSLIAVGATIVALCTGVGLRQRTVVHPLHIVARIARTDLYKARVRVADSGVSLRHGRAPAELILVPRAPTSLARGALDLLVNAVYVASAYAVACLAVRLPCAALSGMIYDASTAASMETANRHLSLIMAAVVFVIRAISDAGARVCVCDDIWRPRNSQATYCDAARVFVHRGAARGDVTVAAASAALMENAAPVDDILGVAWDLMHSAISGASACALMIGNRLASSTSGQIAVLVVLCVSMLLACAALNVAQALAARWLTLNAPAWLTTHVDIDAVSCTETSASQCADILVEASTRASGYLFAVLFAILVFTGMTGTDTVTPSHWVLTLVAQLTSGVLALPVAFVCITRSPSKAASDLLSAWTELRAAAAVTRADRGYSESGSTDSSRPDEPNAETVDLCIVPLRAQ